MNALEQLLDKLLHSEGHNLIATGYATGKYPYTESQVLRGLLETSALHSLLLEELAELDKRRERGRIQFVMVRSLTNNRDMILNLNSIESIEQPNEREERIRITTRVGGAIWVRGTLQDFKNKLGLV